MDRRAGSRHLSSRDIQLSQTILNTEVTRLLRERLPGDITVMDTSNIMRRPVCTAGLQEKPCSPELLGV